MKRLFFFLAAIWVCTAQISAREVININRNWQFSYTSDLRYRTTVDIPHTWNYDAISTRLLYTRGLGNYIKDVTIPSDWNNKKIYIRFHGVNSEANLFVNGHYVGEHKGGYTAFTFEITPFLKKGAANNIWVRVSNSPQLDYMPSNSDFDVYGGIYRDVELIAVDPVHFSLDKSGSNGVYLAQTRITDEEAKIDARIKFNAPKNANYVVSVEVIDPEKDSVLVSESGKIKADKGTGSGIVSLSIQQPRLWHGVYDPFRYTFKVKLADGTKTVDSLAIPMGIRYFELHPENGFMLNGRVYPLHGVARYEDRSGAGNAYHNRMHEEDLDLIREMGANAVRMTNYPHSPYFYELCDRYGVIVWSEIPFTAPEFGADNGFINKTSFRENGKKQLSEMILQRYNNTSVLFWGLFSNLQTRGSDDPVEYIQELNELAKTLDPNRITTASSNQDGPINFVTDAIGWSQYLGWNEGQPADVDVWLAQLNRNWKNLKSAVGEYGAGGSILHQRDTLRRPDPRERIHPERWQTHYHETVYPILQKYPSLWGSFIYSMFDFGEVNYRGGDTQGISNFGLVSYDRKDKKDAFYFYKANWNSFDPFVYITEKRWDERISPVQTVTVYSNRTEVELLVNGVSQGKKTGTNGIFRWTNIRMQEGSNKLEAFADGLFDEAKVTIQRTQKIQ